MLRTKLVRFSQHVFWLLLLLGHCHRTLAELPTNQPLYQVVATDSNRIFLSAIKDGTIYGGRQGRAPTWRWDPIDCGSLIQVNSDGQFQVTRIFNGVDGAFPYTVLPARDGNLYGLTTG